jgi:hypothetical protein
VGLWLVFLVWGVWSVSGSLLLCPLGRSDGGYRCCWIEWLLGVFPVNGPGAPVSPQGLAGRPVLTLVIPTSGHNVRFILLSPEKCAKTWGKSRLGRSRRGRSARQLPYREEIPMGCGGAHHLAAPSGSAIKRRSQWLRVTPARRTALSARQSASSPVTSKRPMDDVLPRASAQPAARR